MTWKAKLTSIDDDGAHVQYYDDASTRTIDATISIDGLASRVEFLAIVQPVVTDLNTKKTKVTSMAAKLANLVGTDIA